MPGIIDTVKGLFGRVPAAARPPLELETTALVAAPALKDAEGETVDIKVLDQEHAAPTLGGIRNIMSGNPSAGLDPGRLAMILRDAINGNADAYYELAEEMEEKYLHYQGVIATRKRAVTQLDITVLAASDDEADQKNADLIRDYLDRDELDGETFDIMDALGKGFSITEMEWDKTKVPWVPCLETRDPRYFEFDRIDGKKLRLKGGPDGMAALPTDLAPYKYIIHRTSGKTGLTVRGGLARSVAWAYLFQNMALKDWVIFADIYGMPIRVGKYDPTATEQDRRKLLQAVMNIATDAAAIIPRSMEVEFINGMAGGNPDVFKSLCEYLDQQVSKLIVGQTATTDATAGGLGGSQGNVHNDVREDIQRADAKALAVTLNRDLVRPLIDLNYGPPASGKYPRIKIGQSEFFTKEDLDILTGLVNMGVEIEASVVRDRAGYSDPPEKNKDGTPVKLLKPSRPAASPPPAQNPAQGAQDGLSGVTAASAAQNAPGAALSRLKTALKTDGGSDPANPDAIDAAIADLRDQWQPVLAPMIDPIQEAFTAASSFDDLKTRLLALPDVMKVDGMAELLARAQFGARLAGEAGLDLKGNDQ